MATRTDTPSTPSARASEPSAGAPAPVRPLFPLIDGLRAVAALSVVGTHAVGIAGLVVAGSLAGRIGARLEVGVAIFFVISGFVLYRPFTAAHPLDRPRMRLGAYAVRRVARIVPAYWLALAVIALVTPLSEVWDDPFRYFLFGQIYDQFTIGFGLTQAWSLCIEVTFYVLLPVWAIGIRALADRVRAAPVRTELLALAVLAVASYAWKVVLMLGQGNPDEIVITPWVTSLPSYLDEFAIGMAFAVCSVHVRERGQREPRLLRHVGRHPWTAVGVAFVAFAISAACIEPRFAIAPMTSWQYLVRHLCYATVGGALVVLAVTGERDAGVVRRMLGSRIAIWFGLLSYGIYLWHDAVLGRAAAWGLHAPAHVPAGVWWPVVGVVGGTALAAVSWYGMERHVLRLAHRAVRSGERPRRDGHDDEPALLASARSEARPG